MRTCSQLFEGISEEECGKMFDCFGAREEEYQEGQTICEFDGVRHAVGVLLEGRADLVRIDVDGNRTILESLEEGGVFGEVLAFSGALGDSIYVTCRKDCRVLFLNYDRIVRQCEHACLHHSVLVQNLFRLLSSKVLHLSERVEVLSCRSIREKLLCYFYQQSAKQQSQTFVLPFTFSTLADYISTDRSAMMRELKRLREEGLVQTDNRKITLA